MARRSPVGVAGWKSPEDEYIRSLAYGGKGPSYKELAERWGIAWDTLRKRGAREKWRERRAQYVARLAQKWEERAIERELSKLEEIDQHADPQYEGVITLTGLALNVLTKQVTALLDQGREDEAASLVDVNHLNDLVEVVRKAHNQRRLVYGGATERSENKHEHDFVSAIRDAYAAAQARRNGLAIDAPDNGAGTRDVADQHLP